MPNIDKLMANPGALANMVRRIALDAGQIVLKYFDDMDFQVSIKDDGSPVSMADREAEAHIQEALANITPDIPIVGEEATAAGNIPHLEGVSNFWLVDALDGTREFIAGGEDFTVNIALVRDLKPWLGIVYAPAKAICYAGYEGGQAIRWNDQTSSEKSIRVRRPPKEGLIVVSSLHHGNNTQMQQFLEQFKVQKVIKRGSSLKMCVIAEGKADLYPRFGPTSYWDIAAGHAVLNAAGGRLCDQKGETIIYDPTGNNFINPAFVASSFDWRSDSD